MNCGSEIISRTGGERMKLPGIGCKIAQRLKHNIKAIKENKTMYEHYERNGKKAWVRSDLKGRQKEFCMCWDCKKFKPETENKGCPIIKQVLGTAAEKNIILPVWECGEFDKI